MANIRTKAVSSLNNFRLFFGLRLSEPTTEYLTRQISNLSSSIPFRNWIHPADLHVTLHFLGDLPAVRVRDIDAAASEAVANLSPFTLELTEPGTFGSSSAPHVLWCGLTEPAAHKGMLAALHAKLGEHLNAFGFATEARRFSPHVTLARKGGPGYNHAATAAAWNNACADLDSHSQIHTTWTVERCTLFRTHLGRRPSYESICEYAFT